MKRKDIDLLIKSAMGEADSRESSQAQSLIASDPAAAKEAAMWEQMKADFKVLAEVPECQLSNERVRAAVLSGSIKQRRSSGFRFWMPAVGLAAAALFAVMFMPRNTIPAVGGGGDAVAFGTEEDSVRTQPLTPEVLIDPRNDQIEVPTIESSATEVAAAEPAVAPTPVRRTAVRRNRTSNAVALKTSQDRQTAEQAAEMVLNSVMVPAVSMATAAPSADAMRTGMAPPAPAAMGASAPSDMEEGVVILSRESTSGTGVPVAVEAGRRHDVVFGG